MAALEPAADTARPTEVTVKPLGAAVAALALVLAGCATARPTPVGAVPSVAGSGSGLVFRIVDVPGLIPAGGSFTMPRMALYGDGLLVLPGSPLHPVARRLTSAGVRKVVQAAIDAGLASHTDYGTPPVMDAGETRFTVVTTHRFTTAVVLPQNDEVTAAQRVARQRLRAFLARLDDLDGWLSTDIAKGMQPQQYSRLAVFAIPHEPDPTAYSRTWPLGDFATAGEPDDIVRCQVISSADLVRVQPNTVWRSGTRLFIVELRPLLPDEKDCGDLG